jgi:hypothetical protein
VKSIASLKRHGIAFVAAPDRAFIKVRQAEALVKDH